MPLPTKRIGTPADEPVSLAQMKQHLNVDADFNDDNELISAMISAAREDAEGFTGRSYCSQQWIYALDRFPFGSYAQRPVFSDPINAFSSSAHLALGNLGQIIKLPYPPLITVDSIVYTAADGSSQTLSPSLYQVDAISEPGRLCPAPGLTWPATAPALNAVLITFTSGYAAVPFRVQQAIRLRAATYYANREEFLAGAPSALPEWFERMLTLEHGSQLVGFVG